MWAVDRRRIGHRCTRCQKSHFKCDGRRPCGHCVSSGANCTSAKVQTGVRFANAVTKSTRVQKPIVQDSWRYISIFFESIGGSVPIMATFEFANIGHISQHDENVSRALSVAGGIYACRNPHLLNLSAKDKALIVSTWQTQKSEIQAVLAQSKPARPSSVLLCALILSIAEILSDGSGNNWRNWVKQLQQFDQFFNLLDPDSELDTQLIAFLRLNDLFGSILRRESYSGKYHRFARTGAERFRKSEVKSSTDKMNRMISVLSEWTELQHRMQAWTGLNYKHPFQPTDFDRSKATPAEVEAEGLEIICWATELQQRVIDDHLSLSREPNDKYNWSLIPFYNWALSGITHLFRQPAWASLDCDLPVMPNELLHNQTICALEHLEEVAMTRSSMDIALYAPTVDFVGLGLARGDERARVLKYVDCVASRGWAIADLLKEELIKAWDGELYPIKVPVVADGITILGKPVTQRLFLWYMTHSRQYPPSW